MKLITVSTTLILFLLLPAILPAMPIGDAPVPYPYAEHNDGTHECIGLDWFTDDGISWTEIVPGMPADITFTVNTQRGDFEWFRIWIDWDLSESWEDDELVISYEDYWFGPGITTITETIMVPSDAMRNSYGPKANTWLRARLSFEETGPEDLTLYGEVEDYGVKSESEAIEATIDLRPRAINLNPKAKSVQELTCYIELPGNYDVREIEFDDLVLEGKVPAELPGKSMKSQIGDYDRDGIPDLMAKFDLIELIEYLGNPSGYVELTVTGRLYDKTPFEGKDTIRFIY